MNEKTINKNIVIAILALIVIGLLFVVVDGVGKGQSLLETTFEEDLVSEEESEEGSSSGNSVSNTSNSTQSSVPVTSSVKTATSPATITTTPDKGMVVVTYTDSGFIPPIVEVVAGGSVTYVNSSSKPMWVTSENHPTAKGQVYRGFDQSKSVGTGGTYNFSFTKVGVWGYKNLNYEKHLGAVSVIPQ